MLYNKHKTFISHYEFLILPQIWICYFCCYYTIWIFLNVKTFRLVNPTSASQIWHAVKAPHHSSPSVRLPHQRSLWGWYTMPQQDVCLWRSSKASISKTWLPTSHPVSTLKRFSWVVVERAVNCKTIWCFTSSNGKGQVEPVHSVWV